MARKRKAAPPLPEPQVEEEESEDEEEEEEEDFEEDPEEDVGEEESEEDSDSESEEEEQEESKEGTVTVRNLLEPLGKDELIDILEEAAIQYPSVLDRINQVVNCGPHHRNIFVFGMGWDANQDQLFSVFREYGEIEQCEVIADKLTGHCKGYGFVLFKTRDGAQKALRERQKTIGNRLTTCNLASAGKVPIQPLPPEEGPNRKIFVANVRPHVDPDRLRDFFAKFGEIEEGPWGLDPLTGKLNKYAIFVYKNEEDCKKVLEEPFKVFEGCHLECRYYVKTTTKRQKVIHQSDITTTTNFVPGGVGAAPSDIRGVVSAAATNCVPGVGSGGSGAAIRQCDIRGGVSAAAATNYVPGGVGNVGFGVAALHQSDTRGDVSAATNCVPGGVGNDGLGAPAIHHSDVIPSMNGMGQNPGMNGHSVNPAAVPIQRLPHPPNRKIFVANVGPHVDPEKLRDFFSMYGEIEEGPAGRDHVTGKLLRKFAIFVYKTEEGCKKALEEPSKIFEGCHLDCRYYVKTTPNKQVIPGASAAAVHQSDRTPTNTHCTLGGVGRGGFGAAAVQQNDIATTNYGMGRNLGITGHNINPPAVMADQNPGIGFMNPAFASNQSGWSHSVPSSPGWPHPVPANLSPSIGATPPLGFNGNYGINRVSPSVISSYGSDAALHGLTAYQRTQLGYSSTGAPAVAPTRPQSGLAPAGTPYPPYVGR